MTKVPSNARASNVGIRSSVDDNRRRYAKVIKGEIHNVLSVMRSLSLEEDEVMIASDEVFESLLSSLLQVNESLECNQFHPDELYSYLSPFVMVIVSPDIGATLTGICINSLHKFVLYEILKEYTIVAQCIQQVTFFSGEAQEEMVVLKLLALSRLVLDQPTSSLHNEFYKNNNNIASIIFHTCYFIAISTSNPLLRSAATDTLSHVILHVCTYTTTHQNAQTLVLILSTLASQLNNDPISNRGNNNDQKQDSNSIGLLSSSFPHYTIIMPLTSISHQNKNTAKMKKKQQQDIQLALSLMNIVFETADSTIFQNQENLLELLQNTVCRYLLQLSTTQNLVTYSLTLRVIFNLFQNLPKNVMFKRLLEIFVTSIHLKILSPTSPVAMNDDSRRIVALESLVEFCREPSLIQDIYCNYDCDVQCTNLFENICTTLYKVASPTTVANGQKQNATEKDNSDNGDELDDDENAEEELPQFTSLNKLAYDGIFSILHSIAKRCHNNKSVSLSMTNSNELKEPDAIRRLQQEQSMEEISDDIYESFMMVPSCTESVDSEDENSSKQKAPSSSGSMVLSLDGQRLLMERKRQKQLLGKVVKEFNASNKEWIKIGQELNVFPTPITAKAVAKFLFHTPKLSKTLLGEYLSKGPHEKYPFHKSILDEFCQLYSFHSLNFCDALRTFLIRFRLPGEAQCIDRLMEAFANELYYQQKVHDPSSNIKQDNEQIGHISPKYTTDQEHNFDRTESLQTVDLKSNESISVVSSTNVVIDEEAEKSLEKDEGLGGYSVHKNGEESISQHSATASIISDSNQTDGSNNDDAKSESKSESEKTIEKKNDCKNELDKPIQNEDGSIKESEGDSYDMVLDRESDIEIDKFPLKSADAAFVLAFSTIMLNTDLHNPTIADERRMTLKQFVSNNRGINDGENVPKAFLTQLYQDIKQTQLQIHPTDTDSDHDNIDHSQPFNEQMAQPCFTTSSNIHSDDECTLIQAGLQDADMFSTIVPLAINCIHSIWMNCSDDILVWKAFQCVQHMMQISLYFSRQETFNELLIILLQFGQDYISNLLSFAILSENREKKTNNRSLNTSGSVDSKMEDDNDNDLYDLVAVPNILRISQRESPLESFSLDRKYLVGCAVHIGFLCLDGAFACIQQNKSEVTCWPELWECMLGLYHLHINLVELDDFADSRGNVLPQSDFALRSNRRLHEYYLLQTSASSSNSNNNNRDGFLWKLSSMFQKKENISAPTELERFLDDEFEVITQDSTIVPQQEEYVCNMKIIPPKIICPINVSEALMDMIKSTHMRELFLSNSDTLTRQLIPQLLKYITSENDTELPFEHYAVYTLEVAVHSLFNNADKVEDMYPLFETTLTSIMSNATFAVGEKQYLKYPYLIERVVISILRFAIHFPHLSQTMFKSLEKILELPTVFLKHFVNRLSCGLAIILRVSHSHCKSVEEWSLLGDLLDRSAKFPSGRRFVFDGVASCVEDYIPSSEIYFQDAHDKSNRKAVDKVECESRDADEALTESTEDDYSQCEYESNNHEKENTQTKTVEESKLNCGDNIINDHLKECKFDKHDESNEDEEKIIPSPITYEGAYMLTRLLLKFIFGSYGGDLSMSTPSMFCLEKTYWYLFHMAADESAESSDVDLVPDEDLWNTVGSAMYSVALSPIPQVAIEGIHCLDRFLTRTKIPTVSSIGWITLLETITSKLPPVFLDELRVKVTNLLGNLLLILIPELCQLDKNIDALTDIVTLTADYVGENLRYCMKQHKNKSSTLQDSTVETFTKIANKLSLSPVKTKDPSDFCMWTAEIFYRELDTFGLADDCNPNLVDRVQQMNYSSEDVTKSKRTYWV